MKKIITNFILVISIIFFTCNTVNAYNLDLNLSSDKSNVKVGDMVTLKLTLSQGMQAADFVINYDSNLLEFNSTSLGDNFYSTKEQGKIICSWFDVKDTKEFTFIFTAIGSGNANFSTTTENFYDSNLQSASMYNESNLSLNIQQSSNVNVQSNNISTLKTNDSPVKFQTIEEISKTSNLGTSTKELPQTGDNYIILAFISFIILMFTIILRIKISKLKDI